MHELLDANGRFGSNGHPNGDGKSKKDHWQQLANKSLKEMFPDRERRFLAPKTPNQAFYLQTLQTKIVTIYTGPAGTGKSYLACGQAARMLRREEIEKIVICRPLVECDEELGTLPGDLWDKVSIIMSPLLDALEQFNTPKEIEKLKADGKLQIVPLGQMRGSTFRKSFVIVDEAQNATFKQLKMFLTRFGVDTKVVVCGDASQSDLRGYGSNPLTEVIERFADNCNPDIGIVKLGREDIVRHPLIAWIDERLS